MSLRLIPVVFLLIAVCAFAPGAAAPAVTSGGQPDAERQERETVTIDDTVYPVPAAWKGKQYRSGADITLRLRRLPLELTLDRAEIHLRDEAMVPLKAMAAAAAKDNILLLIDSGYRSVRFQRQLFRELLAQGRSFAVIARSIAPPGYSEHTLGTAVDFHPSDPRFAGTAAYRWLRRHAGRFGFVETYPRRTAGVAWEPWHWNYRLPPTSLSREEAPRAAATAAALLPALSPGRFASVISQGDRLTTVGRALLAGAGDPLLLGPQQLALRWLLQRLRQETGPLAAVFPSAQRRNPTPGPASPSPIPYP